MEVNTLVSTMRNELFYERCKRCAQRVLIIQSISLILFILLININITNPSLWFDNFSSKISWRLIIRIVCLWTIYLILCLFHINNLSVRDSPVSSKWNLFWRIFRLGNLFQIILYSILSGLTVYCCLGLMSDDKSTLFSVSDDRQCLREFPIFVICHGLIGGFILGGCYFYDRTNLLKFPLVQQSKVLRVREAFYDVIVSCGMRSLNVLKYFCVIYIFFIGKPFVDYLIDSFGVSGRCDATELSSMSVIFDWRLLLVTWFCFFYFYLFCQLTYLFFEVFLTQSYSFAVDVTQPSKSISLVHALNCTDIPIVLHLATYDLLTISQQLYDPRSNLVFALSIPGGHAYTWKAISSQCLILLRQFIDRLSLNISSDTVITTTQQSRLVMSMSGDVKKYKELRRIFIVSNWVKRKWEEIMCKLQKFPLVQFFVPTSTFNDRGPREVFADCQIYIWIIQALTNFIISSIQLNKFGVIQAEITDIITLLIQLEQDLDKRHLRNIKSVSFQRDYFLKKSLSLAVKTSLNRLAAVFVQQLDCLPLSSEQRRNFLERG